MTLAQDLARYCRDGIPHRLSAKVQASFRRLLRDYCGVVLGGSTVASADVMRRALARSMPGGPGGRQASVVNGAKTWVPVAALLNGAAAHSIELDDLHSQSSFHPGAIIFPAALAVAEAEGAGGERFMHAVVAGYEAAVRVGLWITPSALFNRGLHPTGVVGAFGATAAAGIILGLDEDQLARAFGIASDMSTGLMEFNESGSWSKRMHTGWPAHAGCIAAELAAEGFLGSAGIFEGRAGVLFAGSGSRTPVAGGSFDEPMPLAIERIAIKRHACCRFGHGVLDILCDLKAAHALAPQDIASVRIGMFADAMFLAEPAAQKRQPRSVVDAQFSLPYQAASVLVRGHAALSAFTPAAVTEPELHAFAEKISVARSPALDAMFPAKYGSEVEIITTSGDVLREARDHIVGDHDHPLADEQLFAKFAGLAAMAFPDRVARIDAAIENIAAADGPRVLAASMAGDPQAAGGAAKQKSCAPASA